MTSCVAQRGLQILLLTYFVAFSLKEDCDLETGRIAGAMTSWEPRWRGWFATCTRDVDWSANHRRGLWARGHRAPPVTSPQSRAPPEGRPREIGAIFCLTFTSLKTDGVTREDTRQHISRWNSCNRGNYREGMCGIIAITGGVNEVIPREWDEGAKIRRLKYKKDVNNSVSGVTTRVGSEWPKLSGVVLVISAADAPYHSFTLSSKPTFSENHPPP